MENMVLKRTSSRTFTGNCKAKVKAGLPTITWNGKAQIAASLIHSISLMIRDANLDYSRGHSLNTFPGIIKNSVNLDAPQIALGKKPRTSH